MTEVGLHVPDMHCDACERSIRGALQGLPGIGEVRVELPTRRVYVQFDEASTNAAAIKQRIEDAGFDVG